VPTAVRSEHPRPASDPIARLAREPATAHENTVAVSRRIAGEEERENEAAEDEERETETESGERETENEDNEAENQVAESDGEAEGEADD
jgi:hypothetical protein